ncbi:MAG: iron-containing alcohol dehydrogenase [Defluviitaleaceae bacterium]|nr:iron-containing alcohol dehydrogenase [Defluviitaleaceae bacterium]
MKDFVYHAHTKVVFGKNADDSVAEQLQQFEAKGVLLHYGLGSAVKSGLIDKIKNHLNDANIKFAELPGVQPNPRLSMVRQGIAICKEQELDFVLAVGGGSVIDSSKAISVGAADSGDVWDFYTKARVPTKRIGLGAIPTIASAGSETSTSSVIRNEEENTKRSLLSNLVRPNFAILNPTLAFGVSKYSLACGVTDIIMHSLDRYFTDEKGTYLTDAISEGIIRTAIKCGLRILKDPTDYDAMANIFWAGSLSHNDITELGKPRDMTVHALERGISGNYDTAHPAGLALLWPNWAKHVYKKDINRFAQYANRVLSVPMDFENPEATAIEGIDKMAEFLRSIGMPTNFKEANISPTDEEIEQIIHFAFLSAPQIGTFYKLSKEDAATILNNARK